MLCFLLGRSHRVLSLACGLLCALTAVQDPPPAPPDQSPPPDELALHAKAEAEKLTVALLDTGAEPRRALRYAAHVGQKGTLIVSMRLAMVMAMDDEEMPEQTFPELRFTIVGEVKEIAANGDIHSRIEYTEVKVLDEPGIDPEMLAAMQEMCEGVVGITAECVMTARGEMTSTEFQNVKRLDTGMLEQLTDLPNVLAQFGAVLPEEPVGNGARWRLHGPINSGGVVINSVSDFTITELSETEVSLESTATQSADPQDVPIPDMPGQSMRLQSMKSDGGGKMRIRLDSPMGVQGDVKTETSIETSFDLFGVQGTMRQRMSITLSISPGETAEEKEQGEAG